MLENKTEKKMALQNRILEPMYTKTEQQQTQSYVSAIYFSIYAYISELEIKKIFRSPRADQPEKYSRQMQIFSHHFVKCKWRSS